MHLCLAFYLALFETHHNFPLRLRISRILDCTPYIANPQDSFEINVVTHDEDPYAFVLAICCLQSPEMLYSSLTAVTSPDAIMRLPKEEGKKKAIALSSSSIVIVEGDEEIGADHQVGKIIFSLKDSTTKQLQTTPVRGKNCTHIQVSSCWNPPFCCLLLHLTPFLHQVL